MITRGTFGYEVHCDKCPEAEDFECESWPELLGAMEEKGWASEKIDGEWEHRCPDCNSEKETPNGNPMSAPW